MMLAATNSFIAEAIQLLNNSGFQQPSDVKVGEDLVGETAVVRPLHTGQILTCYSIGERDNEKKAIDQTTLDILASKLKSSFNDEDLKGLCYSLEIPYDDLASQTLSGRMIALIQYGQRHNSLAAIVARCRKERPNVTWPDIPLSEQVLTIRKENLAIVVSVAQPALEKVAGFLTAENIDADILLITNVAAYNQKRFLTIEQDWDAVAQDFARTMDIVIRKMSGLNRHFFLAAPMSLIFAMGCIWGTVRTGDKLYHLDRGTDRYHHVLTSSQKWLSP